MKINTLKMTSIGNTLIMVEVKVWSRVDKVFRKIDLTLDTGASVTTISKDLLYRLGYEFADKNKAMITTASGVEYVDRAILDKIMIGNCTLSDVNVYAHTFPEESFSLGVLGLNVLSRFDIELLFSKKLILFKEMCAE